MKNTVFIICGPTSTGKTTLGLELAEAFNGEIISADSRQIYKYMDVGTGKVPATNTQKIQKKENHWVVNGIKVWGYDVAEPDQYYSGYDFAQFALAKAKELLEQGKTVFVVGGTGLYIDIFTARTSVAQVGADLELRKSLENLTKSKLLTRLTSLNVEKAKSIDKDNKARLIRAIEVETGGQINTTPLPYLTNTKFIFIGLTADRQTLYSRADLWLESIWPELLKETQHLTKAFHDSPKLSGLVYKSAIDFLRGISSEADAKQRAKFDLHAYIRRQQTWFKRNDQIKWFDITAENFSQNIKNLVSSK